MRLLFIHSDFLEFEPVSRAIEGAEEVEKTGKRVEDCLVVFLAVEEGDGPGIGEAAAGEIRDVASRVGAERIVLYPFVHLTQEPADPDLAKTVLDDLEKRVKEEFEVVRAPFGWYKSFTLRCKGHPLAELSRKVVPSPRRGLKKEFAVLTPDGRILKPEEVGDEFGEDFRILVEKEALGKESPGGGEPEYIRYCKKFGIDWEPMSDVGHMRFNPVGNFLFEAVSEYSWKLAESLGIHVYRVRGTNLFSLKEKPVREHAELFGDRLYQMKVGSKNFVFRYAACHQQFSILSSWGISHRHLPFGVFEVADAYRYEQSGELLLCFRTRKLHMPDLHVLCRDLDEAREWFLRLHEKIYGEIRKLGRDYVSLYNLTSREFFEKNREFFSKLVELEGKPVLLCFYPEDANFYWILNIEYHIIDSMGRPREIGTVQIDVGNAERFGIKFADRDNRQKHPVILHTAIIGTVERYLYTVFDTVLRERNPVLPLWLSPVQVRLCPVNDSFLGFCEEIARRLAESGVRADIDDRKESVQKKIRNAETDWVPFTVVVGEKERKSGRLSVRFRKTGEVKEMTEDELVRMIKSETEGYPFKPLPVPVRLSERPKF